MNVNRLQPAPHPQLQRTSREASENEAEFLALRLLNKRSRLRLSPQPIDLDALPGRPRLFAVANRAGWFAAAIRNTDGTHALALSPLADLHVVFSATSSDGPLSIQPRVTSPLPATPHIVAFTHDEARLLVAFTNGPLSVYDSQAAFQSPSGISSLHTFPFTSRNPIRDIHPSPADIEVVALVREAADELPVEIIDVHKMATVGGWNAGGSPATNPASVSWSPKGKQIAIGLENGDVVTFSPTDTSAPKTVVPRPQGLDGQSVISTVWLSNTEFHAIYVPGGRADSEAEQSHYILSLDSRANTAGHVKLTCPYLPFPGLRPPGAFIVTLRGWEPSRLLLFIGDSTSSDIGLIGSLAQPGTSPLDSWYNLTLEETSTPSVPLDADMNETVLLGLELDLTNNEPFKYTGPSGEESDVPPPPIMFLYASDGTLTGWHIIQTQGRAYPGMATPSATPASISPAVSTSSNPTQNPSPFAATTPSPSLPNAFAAGAASGTSAGFSAFSGAPAKFGSTTTFGFGSPSQPQALQAPSTPSVSVEMASATEDSMNSGTDAGFGGMSLGGGEDSDSSQTKSGGGAASMFGSFGAPQSSSSSSSPFGSGATASPSFAAFGAGPVKPGTGFGAFGGSGPSAFGSTGAFGGGAFSSGGSAFGGGSSSAFSTKPTSESDTSNTGTAETKPASAFGQSSFGQSSFGQSGFGATASPAPAFGQSAFGQSSFGQSSFGKAPAFGNTSFGATTTPIKPATASAFGGSSGGGFAAFAAAPTSFASASQPTTPDTKPVWASSTSQESSAPTGSAFGGGNAFGASKPAESSAASAFAPAKPAEPAASAFAPAKSPKTTSGAFGALGQSSQGSTFGTSSFGQSSFGQSSFGQSSFGQSAFGKPSAFGQTATPTSTPPKPASTTPSTGGFASFASAGTSAFGAVAQQKSSSGESKPVWATASEDKPAQQEAKPAFGSGSSFSSAFGGSQTSAFSPAATTSGSPASSPETPTTPVSPTATPLATPANKPSMPAAPSTTPATPAFGGAFGGLATSTNAFPKLQSGFGAFGSTTPTTTPFSQKSSSSTQPNVAFGQTSFGAAKTEDKDAATKPSTAFGSPAAFGQTSFFGKPGFGSSPSPFGKTATPAAASSSTTTSSAFSAFSNTTSPFAASAGTPKKSFSDMLREKEGESSEDDKTVGTSKTADAWKKPVSVFASLKQAAANKEEEEEDEDDEGGNISFRSQDDDEGSDPGDDGIDDFLRSDEEDEGEESEEEEEEEEAETSVQSHTPPESPTAKQPVAPKSTPSPFVGGAFLSKDAAKPSSASSSKIPVPVPVIKVEPESPKLPPPRQGSSTPPGSPSGPLPAPIFNPPTPDSKGKAPAREGSTTPPGSPASSPPIPVARSTSAPATSSPSPSPNSGLLGVGRPSTRPTRSSPLASEPISGDDGSDEEGVKEEEEEDREQSPHKKARSASPAFSPASGKGPATSRPKTPPILFGLGAGVKPPSSSPFTLSPGTSSPIFGAKPATPPAEPTKPSSSPPLKGPGAPGTSIFNAPPVFSPPTAPQGGIFGQKPTAFGDKTTAPTGGIFGGKAAAPTGGIFSQKPAAPVFGSPSLSSKPLTPPAEKPPSPAPPAAGASASPPAKLPAPAFGSSSFGFGTPTQTSKPSGFGGIGGSSKLPAPPSATAPAKPPPPSQATVAQGMQTECLYLFSSLGKELEDLKALAKRASARTTQLNKPGSGNKTVEDLGDPTKWILGDLAQFKEIMKEVGRELEKWEKEKATCITTIRELESDMLKATTRKEEIARFHRASQDTEFARMLKARTLSPDHLETQAQLRREIRTMRGRIQQLEDHIQASKKKLNSLKDGKPSIKPPSLDTINRTYRNIDLAIDQEEGDVSSLADRVAQIELTSTRGKLSFSTPSTRDKRLPDRAERIGREVTPNIAASTAAALNAERSAQKLKRALLKARKEPLLNTKAVDVLPPPREVRSSRKPLLAPDSGLGVGAAFAAGMGNGFPSTPGSAPPVWTPPPPGSFGPPLSWSTAADTGSPAPRLGAMRAGKEKQHQKSVPAGQGTTKPAELPPPAGFSWGPLPKFDHAKQAIPGFTAFSAVKVEPSEPAVKVKEEEKDLGSSWIADGFGAAMK
ncbi:hypothetical protein C2E23DRAFT_889067 [Lenzites betulinus]|nr:hypothetical protein C2E23DRAFT_889067 [Lenzites betulinus]